MFCQEEVKNVFRFREVKDFKACCVAQLKGNYMYLYLYLYL